MKITTSLFDDWFSILGKSMDYYNNIIILFNCLNALDRIEDTFNLGLYKSKCNYYIDRNQVKFEIKTIKTKLKEVK